MSLLYEHHYEQVVTPLHPVNPDARATILAIIYDSIHKDYAINVMWQAEGIRAEWGIVKDIDHSDHKFKLVRVDGIWWVPIGSLLQVERI
ncbi:hypothetical protein ACFYU8_29820 [Brevibacillus sp. NPDC003359]|uniref:hypothetical protein n=1 Tax=unclassified Brevibacillus TaxID=2684853 RepID=UPI0036B31F85